MATLLKYEMRCTSEDCGKPVIVLVDPDEHKAPNLCPFCGHESLEITDQE